MKLRWCRPGSSSTQECLEIKHSVLKSRGWFSSTPIIFIFIIIVIVIMMNNCDKICQKWLKWSSLILHFHDNLTSLWRHTDDINGSNNHVHNHNFIILTTWHPCGNCKNGNNDQHSPAVTVPLHLIIMMFMTITINMIVHQKKSQWLWWWWCWLMGDILPQQKIRNDDFVFVCSSWNIIKVKSLWVTLPLMIEICIAEINVVQSKIIKVTDLLVTLPPMLLITVMKLKHLHGTTPGGGEYRFWFGSRRYLWSSLYWHIWKHIIHIHF